MKQSEAYLSKAHIKSYNQQRSFWDRAKLCHAPFNGMYFGIRGNMTPCCANQTQVLGTYPEQSIKEAWFGSKARELRKAIKAQDFSKGCLSCRNLIEAENFTNLHAKNYDRLKKNWNRYPAKMDFELSNICNLECIMCRGELSSSIRKNREKLPKIPAVYDQAFVEELKAFIPYLDSTHFLGGEPFLVPLYLDIWELMTELNPRLRISVQTNATVLTSRVRSILDRLKFNIAISLDSLEKENYAKIRVNGDLSTALENINFFHQYCKRVGTELSISFCPMPQNWHELANFIQFCNSLGCKAFFNTVIFPRHHSLQSLTSGQLREIVLVLPDSATLPARNEAEAYNRQTYAHLIAQINHWYQIALHQEETIAIEKGVIVFSREAYYLALQEYCLTDPEIQAKDRSLLFEQLKHKIDFVMKESLSYTTEEEFLSQLSKIEFNSVVLNVTQRTGEELFALFKAAFIDQEH